MYELFLFVTLVCGRSVIFGSVVFGIIWRVIFLVSFTAAVIVIIIVIIVIIFVILGSVVFGRGGGRCA